MGKNRHAVECTVCYDNLCYYGTTVCVDCEGERKLEEGYEEYLRNRNENRNEEE